RKPYHPKAPSGGSNWVMWVGNMPNDATQDEANIFFGASNQDLLEMSSTSGGSPEAGIESIFLILQSHCAFVNYTSELHLQRALSHFHGRPFRPGGVKLVCRVRRKAEEMKSGVGGQRGLGLHRKWVEEHVLNPTSNVSFDANDDNGGRSSPSISTTSTLLATYFPARYFVLKAMTKSDLQLSVNLSLWATQTHNEFVLDQAFRTSKDVYLVFGANKAGEFHGYANTAKPQWGTPFKVQWISVQGLPFHSTRMLRNPWNKDREVKVSRDGTELEPLIGKQLLDLWDVSP
ncbi:hypothetical protein DL93DRAFT_2048005, partial [Clavulina sp. PMI_390]